jgi:hypothetical protein
MMHGVFALSVTGRNANLRSNDPRESVMPRASAKSLPQLSVRIDLDSEGRIGPGKIELLEQIREHGSISAAGRAMDMSYKRARDLVDEINRIADMRRSNRRPAAKTAAARCSRLSARGWSRAIARSSATPCARSWKRSGATSPVPASRDSDQFGLTAASGIGCVSASPKSAPEKADRAQP